MEAKCTHDELAGILDRNISWIENCDNKASIILGVVGVVAGIFLATDYMEKFYSIFQLIVKQEDWGICSFLYIAFTCASVVGIVAGCLFLVNVLVPRYKMEEYKERGIGSESVIHYSAIARNKNLTKYRNKLMRTSDKDMCEDLIEQIYVCAIICEYKFASYKKGLNICVVSFLVFVFMAIVGFVIT